MKILKNILLSLAPIVLYLFLGAFVITGENVLWILPIMTIFYTIIGYYLKNINQILWATIPMLLIFFVVLFLETSVLYAVVEYIFIIPISTYAGYSLKKNNTINKMKTALS